MIKPIHNPLKGKLKVLGFASNSGKTLWKVLTLQKELEKKFEGSPFEVVGIFSSKKGNKALELAKEYNIPSVCLDIKEYYRKLKKPIKDMNIRAQYDREVLKLIEPFRADLILLAGYVWAATDVILDHYTVINVHPADLSIEENGKRVYAGPNGVGDALSAKEDYICSTSHLATKELDGGPILMISPKVPVNYALQINDKDFIRYYLDKVNAQSRLIGARTVLEIALGNFGIDEKGKIYYKNKLIDKGLRIENWDDNIPKFFRYTEKLIKPKSIAVIGASSKAGIGKAIVENIKALAFKGNCYAVNRKGEDVSGMPGYSSIFEIKEDIDLAVIAVPSELVLDIVQECGKKGVKVIVCISAGFKEVGGIGIEKEKKLVDIVNKYNMRLLGPNCMGILNTDPEFSLNATILHDIPLRGNIGFITQSGALGAGILDFAHQLAIGFSIISSVGNQSDLNINDLLLLLAEDEKTKIILLYIESIPEPARFIEIASRVTKTKPVIIIKSGRTSAGAAAANSHTGSLAGNDIIADALIQKTGCIRVKSLEDGFHLAATLSKVSRIKGKRVAVVTNAGGPGILVADALNDYGFELPLLEKDDRIELSRKLLPEASTSNPIDLVAPAPPEHYAEAIKYILKSNKFDALLIVCVPPATIDTGKVAEKIVDVLKESSIPVLTCFLGPNLGEPARKVLRKAGIPTYTYPEQMARILSYMKENNIPNTIEDKILDFHISKKLYSQLQSIIWKNSSKEYLPPSACEKILTSYGLDIAASKFIKFPDEVDTLKLKYPIVAKIDHPQIIHKSDVGGVVLDINDNKQLKTVVKDLFQKFPGCRGIQVQEQASQGIELILGSAFDDHLGHSMMLGLGGTMVEVIKDVSFGYVPLDLTTINRMIINLKSYKILKGYRGKKGIHIDKLKEYMLKLNRLLLDFPEIRELDLNPVIYSQKDDRLIVVDYRIKIR